MSAKNVTLNLLQVALTVTAYVFTWKHDIPVVVVALVGLVAAAIAKDE